MNWPEWNLRTIYPFLGEQPGSLLWQCLSVWPDWTARLTHREQVERDRGAEPPLDRDGQRLKGENRRRLLMWESQLVRDLECCCLRASGGDERMGVEVVMG